MRHNYQRDGLISFYIGIHFIESWDHHKALFENTVGMARQCSVAIILHFQKKKKEEEMLIPASRANITP
jgi:hypothetical protein